ncbi:MAG: C-3',4' desaturase CrtD [Pseudanabaenaceae cyanobacterium bins.68]|nr:C-3',4' desaturase CrtD [Pseudanabaenaceae cyanobacterium bins.68]
MHTRTKISVIGAGIGGLTAAALLAKRGYEVSVYEQAAIAGGCASSFQRRGFWFDVGATQVAGLEPGGIHHQIFTELGVDLPAATLCDPACAVFLPGESQPISVWHDPIAWQQERQRQFPGSEPFWQFMQELFAPSWRFHQRFPVLPPRSWGDLIQLIKALRPDTLTTMPYTFATVGDALRGFGLAGDRRLRTFLDLQLKLYSQVNAAETALLYGATALAVSQAPLGLYHLQGRMQTLTDALLAALAKYGGKIYYRHLVQQLDPAIAPKVAHRLQITDLRTQASFCQTTDQVIANVPLQNLHELLGKSSPYGDRLAKLPPPSVAFVVYLGVDQAAIPTGCPPHLQFLEADGGRSLFVSVSKPGDGRAPAGQATITASEFTETSKWANCPNYGELKQQETQRAIAQLGKYFDLENHIRHQEAGTPQTFARYTARAGGQVGGLGMRVGTFGPFGIPNRTPIPRVWLVGDCTHPGEGTAGVSYGALTVVGQIVRQAQG